MDKELKKELEWINENLKAMVTNENMMYSRLKDIEAKLEKEEEK